jgi:hypothetical protein
VVMGLTGGGWLVVGGGEMTMMMMMSACGCLECGLAQRILASLRTTFR